MIKERKVLVTGSSDGIGRSITLSLLNSGAKVIGLARDHSKFNPEMKNYIKYKTDFSNEEILKAEKILKFSLNFFYKNQVITFFDIYRISIQ